MKKYLLFLLFLIFICFCLLPKKDKYNHNCKELYSVLINEDFGQLDKDRELYINIGIDYIPNEFVMLFEELTGIKVVTDIFDSNEMLEAKLLAGRSQYDIVFPTAWPNFSKQLNANIYQKIDFRKIDRLKFDNDILERLSKYNNADQYCLPYQFGISGIGINKEIIDKFIDIDDQNSLAMIFSEKNIKKLSAYGVSIYSSPDELFPTLLSFLGLDPESENEDDIIIASDHLKKISKYITKFTSNGFEDLASENACITLATSGDIVNVQSIKNDKNIKFIFPKEGAPIWVDVVAIPINAEHMKNIYAFFRFLFHPMVIAYVTNKTSRANAVKESCKFIDKEIIENKNIYPDINMRKKCYVEKPVSFKIESLKNRLLTKIKSMDNDSD